MAHHYGRCPRCAAVYRPGKPLVCLLLPPEVI